jgi:galactosamine-6-phosphate isomerase
MNIIKIQNYEEMSIKACEILISCLKNKPDALFCIATGSSPTRAYQLFTQRVKEEKIDTSQMRIIKLDEWCGLPLDNPSSCDSYIRKHILEPLNISEDRYISFNSLETDSQLECKRIEQLLKDNGRIDCCVLGIGKNGHLGLNEPNDSINPFIQKIELDEKTKTHTMLSSNKQEVTHGYTLGLKDILDSKEILLLITGPGKDEAYEHLKEASISSRHPANYLWLHNQTECIVDLSCFKEY